MVSDHQLTARCPVPITGTACHTNRNDIPTTLAEEFFGVGGNGLIRNGNLNNDCNGTIYKV